MLCSHCTSQYYLGPTVLYYALHNSRRILFAGFLQNRSSKKFHNVHRKTALLDSLFNKVAGFATLLKTNCSTEVFLFPCFWNRPD